MEYHAHTCIPLTIVPYKSKTPDTIYVDVIELKVTDGETLMCHVARALLVSQCNRQRTSKKPIVGKDPIIGIASTNRYIRVLYLIEHQSTIYRNAPS